MFSESSGDQVTDSSIILAKFQMKMSIFPELDQNTHPTPQPPNTSMFSVFSYVVGS